VEPGISRTTVPASQEGAAGFHKGRNAKGTRMSTELSTNTTPARGLALATFDDAWRFWQMVAKTDFAPKDFKGKPEACMLAGQHGAELGLGPMQSLQCIAVINGRPSIWGDAALALVQSSAVCEYVVEELEEGKEGETLVAVCTAKRRGYPKPTVVRFSVADAKKAGLWGKSGPWTQYPKRMLQLRARGFALRDAFPDVLKGLVTAEEAQDYPTAGATETHAAYPRAEKPEPVVVRPKFDTPTTTEPAKRATADDMRKARHYVQTASKGQLEAMQGIVEQRLKAGFYTSSEADDLFDLINGKLDILSAEPEDAGNGFPHEAAESEVMA
jgi:hypothetical protein